MNTDKMREEFEKWYSDDIGVALSMVQDWRKDEGYRASYERCGLLWYGWQASRAAIEVELPSPHQGNFGWMHQDFAVQRAIEASGLRWKQGQKRTLSDIIDSLGPKVNP